MAVLAKILQYQTDQVLLMGMIFTTSPLLLNNRLVNVGAPRVANNFSAWNGHLWDVSSSAL
jgi:hypothetical protein